MDYFSNLFQSMFKSSVNRYKTRVQAQVKRQTVGRVQAKMMKAQDKLDQAAYRATDRATGLNKGQDMGSDGFGHRPQQQGGAPARGGGGGGGGRMQGGGGSASQGGAMVPASNVAKKQQGSAKMGKGNRNKRQQAMAVSCMSCGSDLQAGWDMCPYCGTPVGQVGGGAPAPQIGMGMGIPAPVGDTGEKTMAINIGDLDKKEQRSVVGWIVAQNGNHRGEDFRIYDGKNILGTAADCDIVITDPYLSAKHATIRHENGNFQVTDLDSMNGTFVNQKRCTKSDLIDNDTIRLGRTEFKFKSLF